MANPQDALAYYEKWRKPEHAFNVDNPEHLKQLLAVLEREKNCTCDTMTLPMTFDGLGKVEFVTVMRSELQQNISLFEDMLKRLEAANA